MSKKQQKSCKYLVLTQIDDLIYINSWLILRQVHNSGKIMPKNITMANLPVTKFRLLF